MQSRLNPVASGYLIFSRLNKIEKFQLKLSHTSPPADRKEPDMLVAM